MAETFDTKKLGEGTIGGRGWWLVRESVYTGSSGSLTVPDQGHQYNTNTNVDRLTADATTFSDALPHVGPSPMGRLEFYLDGWTMPALNELSNIGFGSVYPWIFHVVGTVSAVDLYARFEPVGLSGGFTFQRHAGRTQYDNLSSTDLLSAADRIQIGNSGYTDTLPGLFLIQPVAGTISAGVSCQVTIQQFNNHFDYWSSPDAFVKPCNFHNYGSTYHPYFRDDTEPVTVSLVSGNHNLHVIPGVDLQFVTTPLDSSRAVVAIGHEYLNRWSEIGDLGDIAGRTDFFLPLASYGLVSTDGAVSSTTDNGFIYRWHVYNVSGALQEGCQFHVVPLVRLDQGNSLTPFDQWFMGAAPGTLGPPITVSLLTFTDYAAGSPPTITMLCNQTVDMLVTEINPTTYVSTGTTHATAAGLKCDGETLYRWDAVGVYFVLSATANASSTATMWTKYGREIERRLLLTDDQTGSAYVTETAPFSVDIGTWGAITDDEANPLSASPYVDESYWTGAIQTQGFDQEFFHASLHATQTHWYNHDFTVCTYPGLTGSNHGFSEYAVMVTSDDPLYFQVVPMTFLPAADRMGTVGTQTVYGTANVAGALDTQTVIGSANVLSVRKDLAIRVNQIQPDLVDLLAEHGVTIEATE
jgi:hypothetical protein